MEVIWIIAGFFLVSVTLAWMLSFPATRETVINIAGRAGTRLFGSVFRLIHSTFAHGRGLTGAFGASLSALMRAALHQRLTLAVLVALMAVPSIVIMRTHRQIILSGFESDVAYGTDHLIAPLLRGERLAPPPAPPPEMFTTREVELIRPKLGTANREWDLLDADFRQRLLVVYKLMRENYGYEMQLLEGYRSPERQNELAASGSDVTNARAFQSYHQYGLAADSAFKRKGTLVISDADPWAMRGYELFGALAESAGLTWGGKWTLRDYGHVELRPDDAPITQAR